MTLHLRSGLATPSTDGAVASSSRPRAGRSHRATIALVVAVAVVASGFVLGSPRSANAAPSYPSWSDVQKATDNQQRKQSEIAKIQRLLQQLNADVVAKQAVAVKRGEELQQAQTAYDEQEATKQKLQAKADAADRVSKASEVRAGQLAAQLGRTGTDNLSTDLIANPGKASNLLYKLGAMSKLTEQANGIYAQAVQDRNTAQSLTDQARVAAQALSDLAAKAQVALVAANTAATEAQTAVAAQKSNADRLRYQLAALTQKRTATQEAYNAGVVVRRVAAAKAAAKAAAEAARLSGATGFPNSQGWTKPAGGYITSGFGYRLDPATHVYQLHAGTDLGASCGSNIYAAAAGTVIYAGPFGGYGNFVLVDNGNGINTGYGHVVDGGIHVATGQHVSVGQVIAQVGSTGWSTGCHLHFETRVGGVATDAVPFMAARGVTL
jgi:murein DD-endopeptidase MepM/ murein hydrolase activator NlpD